MFGFLRHWKLSRKPAHDLAHLDQAELQLEVQDGWPVESCRAGVRAGSDACTRAGVPGRAVAGGTDDGAEDE